MSPTMKLSIAPYLLYQSKYQLEGDEEKKIVTAQTCLCLVGGYLV